MQALSTEEDTSPPPAPAPEGPDSPNAPTPKRKRVRGKRTRPTEGLPARLFLARQVAGISAQEAGDAIKRSEGVIRNQERGVAEPRALAIHTLAELYKVSVEWLMTGRGEGPKLPATLVNEKGKYPSPPLKTPVDPPEPAPTAPNTDPKASRFKYRLICPACGKSIAPDLIGRHLVEGDACERPHSYHDAEALLQNVQRDPEPWWLEMQRLRTRITDFQRMILEASKANDEKRRRVYQVSLDLLERSLSQIEALGPEKFEWRDG